MAPIVEDLQRDLWLAFRMLCKSANLYVHSHRNTYSRDWRKYNDLQSDERRASQIGQRSSRGSSGFVRVQPGEYGYAFNYRWFKRIGEESSSLMQVFGSFAELCI